MRRGQIGFEPNRLALIAYHQSMWRIGTGFGESFGGTLGVDTANSDSAKSATTDRTKSDGMLRAHSVKTPEVEQRKTCLSGRMTLSRVTAGTP